MSELPVTWTTFTIKDIGGTVGGKTPSKHKPNFWNPAELPWASPKDMKMAVLEDTQDHISYSAIDEAGMALLPESSVLVVTRSGILAHSLPVAITGVEMAINQDIKAITPTPHVEPAYLAYALRAHAQQILHSCSKQGTTVASVVTTLLEDFPIPLAPLNEQKRIAEKLDAVLARIHACREKLERVPAILTQFRQSVLQAATTGELTKDWREERGLEMDWEEVELGEVALSFDYGTSAKSQKHGKVPVLRMGNLQDGVLDWSDLVYTSDKDEIKKYALEHGDVLFNRTNSPELVGKTAVYKGERPAIHAGYLIRVKCGQRLKPEFINYCLNSPAGKNYCWRVKSDGVSQSNINAKKLAAFEFLLPPVDEQVVIVERVERLLQQLNEFHERHKQVVNAVTTITSAVLAKAFRGELVPQDPADEPASVLLDSLNGIANPRTTKRGRKKTHNQPELFDPEDDGETLQVAEEGARYGK